jgi:hypothetical protein
MGTLLTIIATVLILHLRTAQLVQTHIPDQSQQMLILLGKNRFIAVLEQMVRPYEPLNGSLQTGYSIGVQGLQI